MKLPVLLFGSLLLCPAALRAQAPARVEHLPAAAIRAAVAGAAEADNGTAVSRGADRGAYTYVVVRRDRPGEAEVHDLLDDVIVVQEGSGLLRHGGTLSGSRETGPGELRGGEIAGGETRRIAAGDLVIVPAGVPHRVEVEEGGSVTYLVLKVRVPGAPGTR